MSSPTTEASLPSPPVAPVAPPDPGARLLNLAGKLVLVLFLAALFTPGSVYSDDKYWLPLYTRYMAVALFALSVDLVWGYTGLLSLGQGLYFGMGVYAVGYSLMFQKACLDADKPLMLQENMPRQALLADLPDWTGILVHIWLAIGVAVILPTLFAMCFGYLAFLRKIKGVYFSIITQAILLAFYTLADSTLKFGGGRVGMPNLPRLKLFDHEFTMVEQFYLNTGMLCLIFVLCYLLVQSKFGKVLTAIRDSEYRVLALGYNTALYKTFVFALAAAIAGIAGGLYVSSLRTAGPDVMETSFSIEVVILVAVGGRGTLIGAVLGAILVSLGKTYINDTFATLWPIILGGLFVAVVLFLPDGILGGLRSLLRRALGLDSKARAAQATT